jgi:hypothetical protein
MSDAKSKIKTIPKFRSKAEEREFWATHDTTGYFEDGEMVPLAPLLKGKKLVHIYVAPDGVRYEIRKLSSRRPAKNKSRTRKEPFLVG